MKTRIERRCGAVCESLVQIAELNLKARVQGEAASIWDEIDEG